MKNKLDAYLDLLNQHDIEKALDCLADDFRLHFTDSDFIIDKSGYLDVLGWDKGVDGAVSYKDLEVEGQKISGTFTERNRFFELLGIEKLRSEVSYLFNNSGLIVQQTYTLLPNQPSFQEKIQPAINWAKEARPQILKEIYPQDQIIFNEEMGKRWVILLEEWKTATQ